VSLLDMLDFAARPFLDLAHNLGLVLGIFKKTGPYEEIGSALGTVMSQLPRSCRELGLPVTGEMFNDLVLAAFSGLTPEKKRAVIQRMMKTGEVQIEQLQFSNDQMCQRMETIYAALRAELNSLKLRVVAREKSRFVDDNWLENSILAKKYPETIDEFHHAGRCYAYGENAACVFHLMRAAEFYLTKVGKSLTPALPFDPKNWMEIGRHITREMEKKYQDKSVDWRSSEPFYAGVLTDIQALSRAHRNPALHDLEKKYDETEAKRMIDIILGLAEHVAEKI
jgi:hypothetical protein